MTLYGIAEEAPRQSRSFSQKMLPPLVKWLKGNSDSVSREGENERNINAPSEKKVFKMTLLISWMSMENKQYLVFWLVLIVVFKFFVFFPFDVVEGCKD